MRLILSAAHILLVAPGHRDPGDVVAALTPVLARHEIDATPERLGMFLAQWAHESSFICQAENLNYSRAGRICSTWPTRFPTLASAGPYVMNPRGLANRVYNGRMGNSPGSDDGWIFRGRGWCQLTGRDAYRTYGRLLALDLERDPDLLLRPEVSAAVCGLFWANRGLNRHADAGDMLTVTQAINGGQIGLADRLDRYRRVVGPLRELAAALAAQEQLVHPVEHVYVNGVEVDAASASIEGDTITLPSGTHRIGKQTRVGVKLYVTTQAS